jgi:lysophospholipase L1-like esterase
MGRHARQCSKLGCWLAALFLLAAFASALAAPQFSVINGGFEDGLNAWQSVGAVRLETNHPLSGKFSAVIGPGPGSLSQRIEIGAGNDFTVSALVPSPRTNQWDFVLRFLDTSGHEVMRVDSLHDIRRDKQDPRKFSHFMKAHPLTKWLEIVISNHSSENFVMADDVALDMTDENAASLQPVCDLDQAMRPFWQGKRVSNEAVLMLSENGKPASGQLMFRPSRILSVRDYGLATNYVEGKDYRLDGRALTCPASSRLPCVPEKDLLRGELQWNVVGGKQVMVTYEHDDASDPPHPAYLGGSLPNTTRKLKERAPLTIVAYGDSITHGLGESRLSHIRPFLPPWPELVVHRLAEIYHDDRIRYYNSAQSGADSNWGAAYAKRMVASLNPDLVLVAFGQNDFWNVSPSVFASNIASIIKTVREKKAGAEFLLLSPLRFDPAYTTNSQYWNAVGEYAQKLKGMTAPGVQFVDMAALSEWVYAVKKPKDCLNDPLHPNDYFARWYAQSVIAALAPQ